DVACKAASLTEIVRGHDDLDSRPRNTGDDVLDAFGRERIEARRRFVEEDDLGITSERPCERKTLLLAARKAAGRAIGERSEPNLLEQASEPGPRLRDTCHLQRVRYILRYRPAQHHWFLKHESSSPTCRSRPLRERNSTLRGFQQ